ncbi:putative magnesium/proton exchanger-like [Capsicum annuum]|nr:putative magnesium/proton exchanger-like [Capsicum annuum]
MSPKASIESCAYQFNSWNPFNSKGIDYDSSKSGVHSKRQCRSDRTRSSTIESAVLDMSKLSLFDEKCDNLKYICGNKRRRRRGSRSVSGRSSDRSGNRRRCCSVGASAAYGTCSDFHVAVGTDSSGELFVNGGSGSGGGGDVMHWTLDGGSSEVVSNTTTRRSLRKEKEESNVNVLQNGGNFEGLGNESGYGSEPGYRGDAEFGYGDEFDEEEDDQRVSFWGDEFGVSGRSSDRSGNRRWWCSAGASAAYETCSDFHVGVGTDSSGELFVNGGSDSGGGGDIMHWMLDGGSSEVVNNSTTTARSLRKEKEESNVNFEGLGNESGYGSEPGYRGDAEFGYGDEFDEEEDDQRVSFWGDEFGVGSSRSPKLVSGSRSLKLVSGSRSPKLVGRSRSPKLVGGSRSPKLVGGSRSLKLVGGSRNPCSPKLVGGSRNLKLVGDSRSPKLVGGSRNLKLVGGSRNLKLVGGSRTLSRMEKVGENTLQKVHHRCRRRKQDCRMAIP